MEARFNRLGLVAERVEALTPAAITEEQKARFGNFKAYRWLTEGELACSLSHQAAMRQFLATGSRFAAIFEDDVILSASLGKLLDDFERHHLGVDLLRIEADNVRLRLAPQPEHVFPGFAVFKLHASVAGSAGYIISRNGAQRISASEDILRNPADEAMFNPRQSISKSLVVRQLDPALILQEDRTELSDSDRAGSDLETFRRERSLLDSQNFWRRTGHNIRDFVRRDIVMAGRNLWAQQFYGVRKRVIPFRKD